MLNKDNLSEEQKSKLEERKQDKFLIDNLKKSLFLKYISEDTTEKQDLEYKKLIENKYEDTYKEMLRIISLRDYNNEEFEKEISQPENKKMFLQFMHENYTKKAPVEELFRDIRKEDIQKKAVRPVDYIHELHFDDEFYKKLSKIFDTQMDAMNQRIDSEVESIKRLRIKSTGEKVKNPLKEAMLSICKKEYGLKAIQAGLAATNPISASVFVATQIVKSKTFNKVVDKVKSNISEKLDNSESFQAFKKKNKWISKLKANMGPKTKVGLVVGAVMGASLAAASGNIDPLIELGSSKLELIKDNYGVDIKGAFSGEGLPKATSTVMENGVGDVGKNAITKGVENAGVATSGAAANGAVASGAAAAGDAVTNEVANGTINETVATTVEGHFEVQKGDSLWSIAKGALGAQATNAEILQYTKDLVEANKDAYPSLLENPDLIFEGWQLQPPATEDPSLTNKLKELGERAGVTPTKKITPN